MDSLLKTGTLFGVGHYSRLGHYSNNYGKPVYLSRILVANPKTICVSISLSNSMIIGFFRPILTKSTSSIVAKSIPVTLTIGSVLLFYFEIGMFNLVGNYAFFYLISATFLLSSSVTSFIFEFKNKNQK